MDNQGTVEAEKPAAETTATDTSAKGTETAKDGATATTTAIGTSDAGAAATAASEAGKGEDDGKKSVWSEDWREQASLGDEDRLKLAKRYGSPAGILKALQETQAKLRSGTVKMPKPDASDEKAMAEWRKAEGIPESADGYTFTDQIKAQMTPEDKPLMVNFTEYAHKQGAPQSFVDMAAGWYFDSMEKLAGERKAKDAQDAEALETSLRQDWGREYKANYELGRRFLSQVPGVGQEWANAVLPDGRLLGNVPEFVQWASDQGRATYGDPVFASSDSERRHSSRREEIEKIRNSDFDRYEREGLDKEYRQIIEKDLARAKR